MNVVISWDHPAAIKLRQGIVMNIVEDMKHEGMYRIQWPDGVLSEDFYNLARAKDHAAKVQSTIDRLMPRQKPLEARTAI